MSINTNLGVGIVTFQEFDFNTLVRRNYNWPHAQGMRANRHNDDRVQLWLDDRPATAKRVRGRTCRSRDNQAVATLAQIQGIGLLTSTALVAAAGSPHHFKSGRHFSAWLGITPREFSSGNRRYLGRISKQGDKYLRTLLIHGARSVLIQAQSRSQAAQPLNRLQRWAVQLQQRVGHNKAAVGLANKLARICWAVWQHQRDYDGNFALSHAA